MVMSGDRVALQVRLRPVSPDRAQAVGQQLEQQVRSQSAKSVPSERHAERGVAAVLEKR